MRASRGRCDFLRFFLLAAFTAVAAGCGQDVNEMTDLAGPEFHHRDGHKGGPGNGGDEDEDDGTDGADPLYRITMSGATDAAGEPELLTTEACNDSAYIVAVEGRGKVLEIPASDPPPGPDGLLAFANTGESYERKHPVTLTDGTEKGTTTVFDDECFGWTTDKTGRFAIFFEKQRGQETVRLQWHFDYYIDQEAEVREHYTLRSDRIPLPDSWDDFGDGDDFTGQGVIEGPIELAYYYNDADTQGSSQTFATPEFRFHLRVEHHDGS